MTDPFEAPSPTTCSGASLAVGEPLAGTAPFAEAWLIIEQEGPYGPNALVDSHLPERVGLELTRRTDNTGIKVLLVRKPGSHPDNHHQPQLRRVWWAFCAPHRVAMCTWATEDPNRLLELDLQALATGDVDAVHDDAVRDDVPLLLICTHARRDVCCARIGRPIASALAVEPHWAGRVWESSHIGGHRFAPTVLQLPHGWVHGRLGRAGATEVLERARTGELAAQWARGRSSLVPAAQAADLAVRAAQGLHGIDQTAVRESAAGSGTWVVETAEHSWTVTVGEMIGATRPESCGKVPGTVQYFNASLTS